MIFEMAAIILCRTTVMILADKKYMFSFGSYEGQESSLESTSFIIVAMLAELAVEYVIDIYAVDAETQQGIDHTRFWKCIRVLPRTFAALHICFAVHGLLSVIWSFTLSV